MTPLSGSEPTISTCGGRGGRWWRRVRQILASLLPADADREKFLHVLGIHGDPVEAKKRH